MEKLTLVTKQGSHELPVELNKTIVHMARERKIPWGYACERGICAQCRTKVEAGAEYLNSITEAEKLRLRKAERAENFRLGCQIRMLQEGFVQLRHQPY